MKYIIYIIIILIVVFIFIRDRHKFSASEYIPIQDKSSSIHINLMPSEHRISWIPNCSEFGNPFTLWLHLFSELKTNSISVNMVIRDNNKDIIWERKNICAIKYKNYYSLATPISVNLPANDIYIEIHLFLPSGELKKNIKLEYKYRSYYESDFVAVFKN